MSKIINFNARDFHLDENCTTNVGERMFITDFTHKNTEVFEIGDWQWNWTQIYTDAHLEHNTDYIFRFAVEGGLNNTDDAFTRIIIAGSENWDERFTYNLEKSMFSPVISKKYGNGLLRIFEIPFNSGDYEFIIISIIAMHAVCKIMPALDNEAYSALDDMTYQQWWESKSKNNYTDSNDFNGNFSNQIDSCNINLAGAKMSAKTLKQLMKNIGDGCNVDLSGVEITDDKEFDEMSKSADIHSSTKNQALDGMQAGLRALQAQYENFAENSVEKNSLKIALEEFEKQLKKFES